jgi:4-amino-4-deoxy-L-arabinose transferase-like glycosyltransferase
MKEPTVLDYVKSLYGLTKNKIHFRPLNVNSGNKLYRKKVKSTQSNNFPFRAILGLIFALIAQSFLDTQVKNPLVAIPLYAIAGILIWQDFHPESQPSQRINLLGNGGSIRSYSFYLSLVFAILAFFSFSGNRFTIINLSLWLLTFFLFLFSVWEKNSAFHLPQFQFDFFIILVILSIVFVVFFRFYQLQQVPGEMFSDHAEKLLDVSDVLNGQYSIFFPRNTGREAFQFYLTAFIIKLFGTGLTFTSLKIGTIICGLFTLPYVYLLGKELANRWVGLTAFFLAGIAYWPNIISRIGLRFPLYALFAAPTLYYLILGLRSTKRNYFILSGIALGLGLHGYSPFRIVPFVVLIGFILALITSHSPKYKRIIFWYFGLLVFTALIIFLPLLRYALENPSMFGLRAFSRLTSIEQPMTKSALEIFFGNFWNALTMFFNSNGEIWVHSIPFRPALDLITAVFFFLGLIYLFKKYYIWQRWEDFYILALIPLLMLPSILSLAFPRENPSLNRTGAAIIPVFIIAGLGIVHFFGRILNALKKNSLKSICISSIIFFLLISCYLNFQLVFRDFNQQYMQKAWNTSEMGQVIKDFVKNGGKPDAAFVIPYPYWVDTRLVGINAGYPTKDYALTADHFAETEPIQEPKIFIIYPDDGKSLQDLQAIYPNYSLEIFNSKQPGKNFIILRIG